VGQVRQARALGTRSGSSRSASPSWSMIQATAASTPAAPEKCSARTALLAAPRARLSDPDPCKQRVARGSPPHASEHPSQYRSPHKRRCPGQARPPARSRMRRVACGVATGVRMPAAVLCVLQPVAVYGGSAVRWRMRGHHWLADSSAPTGGEAHLLQLLAQRCVHLRLDLRRSKPGVDQQPGARAWPCCMLQTGLPDDKPNQTDAKNTYRYVYLRRPYAGCPWSEARCTTRVDVRAKAGSTLTERQGARAAAGASDGEEQARGRLLSGTQRNLPTKVLPAASCSRAGIGSPAGAAAR
jgi:hypothetical protein